MSADKEDSPSGSLAPDPTTIALLIQGLDQLPIPMHVISKDHRILYTNEAAASLVGEKREDMIGKKCYDIFKSPNCKTPNCTCEIAMEKKILYSVDVPIGDRVIYVTSAPLMDSTGTVIGAIEYFPDVTGQKKAIADIITITEEAKSGDLSARTDLTLHTGDFKKMAEGINNLLDIFVEKNSSVRDFTKAEVERMAANLSLLAEGDLNFDLTVRPADEFTQAEYADFLKMNESLHQVQLAVCAVINDGALLTESIGKGKLSVRADTSRHKGDFRQIMAGFNQTLDDLIRRLRIVSVAVSKIGMGVIPEKITTETYGEFIDLRDNLNACIDGLGGLVEANQILERMANNDYSKGIEGNYLGLFEEVKIHVNTVKDRVNTLATSIEKIGDGDLSEWKEYVAIEKRSEQDRLIPGFIRTLKHLHALTEDTGKLARSAIEGRLETRADASAHEGEYRKIIEGINQTLDAVIGPLNIAADYVDQVSTGIMPEKITAEYKGDFNVLMGNFNHLIDVMRMRNDEIEMLIEAAIDGKLETRADPSKFEGGNKKMMEGINAMLDAVIGPLHVAADYVDKISSGEIPQKITDQYYGDFNTIKNNLNNCIDAIVEQANTAQKIAEGDLSVKVNVRSDNDLVAKSLVDVINVLANLQEELLRLTEASSQGKLTERGRADQFNGAYADVIHGVNHMLDEIILPIEAGNKILRQIRGGDLSERVEIECYGDHQKMKDAINGVHAWLNDLITFITKIANGDLTADMEKASERDQIHEWLILLKNNINALVVDAELLSAAAVEGKLETRADTTKLQGNYRKIIEGFNQTLDAVIGPLNIAIENVEKIAIGVAPDKITAEYKGDFNHLMINLNHLVDVMTIRNAEIEMLIEAAINGKLATRADPSKFEGGNRKMMEGVNAMLEAVIGPLNVAADYVDKISSGAIPLKITDQYNGDFNTIKNNLNTCIDHINALVADANMLSMAAVEGRLATRADATKHQGDYRKIVEGVNQTLDSVIGPVIEATRVAKEFSQYNYAARIDKNLILAGDFITVKEAMDNIGIAVSAAIGDIGVQVTDLAASAEEANASVEEVVSGAQQVAESAGKVSSNAEKGNQGLEQVLKAMEDLSAAVEEVTANTEAVATLANGANTLSKDGAELARKAELGMVGITRSTTEVDQIIGEIKVEMQKIGKIVGLISDLASQTNLLALNAAIEAARAGDAGRGFAVVAAEVKSLAQESRTSAESIAEMIGGLQQKSELAAVATASASKEVGEGSAVLSETLNVFNRIVGDIEKITRSVEEVASASEEQAATVEEITASVHEVSSLIGETASDAGDAAAASEESSAAIDEVGKIIENVNVVVDKVSMGIGKFRV
ncbi:methyl-accepting chemotaxis protein [Methanosphaerula palustris]|uniref:Methyl-accepting chemotaxis sensory transducer with Pas/Pac sensor n=1 Tax=Methanosphaerula palustris (strain ATCC BAA-1556 / DSM 19958 / E1-9c) TaxID=521011 RepID=B8GJH7_METPE|nr:methyl-accepting chemotaxis protein [Methanosphaerula palustris]ACL17018.1 methyl-accepting chemotaxis sensory transducer with Pas/Pac sensor [Methanosphaerula palustris E1-9c]